MPTSVLLDGRLKSSRMVALTAILGFAAAGVAALNHTTPSTFPHSPVPERPRGGCAVLCSEAGPDGFRWGVVHRLAALDACGKTQLLESNIRFPLTRDDQGATDLRACTADGDEYRNQEYGPSCGTGSPAESSKADIQLLSGRSSGQASLASSADVAEAARELARNLEVDPTCSEVARLAKKGSAVLGVFVGGEVQKSSVAALLDKYADYIESASDSFSSASAAQLCGPKQARSVQHSFGIISDAAGDIAAVHGALGQWYNGECLEGLEASEVWPDQDPHSGLLPRAECKTYEVRSGDDCWSIATKKCGLKDVAALYKLNSKAKKWCEVDGILPGDHFCCNKGTMPDFTPKPNKDGTCKHELKPDLRPKKKDDGTCFWVAIENKLCDEIQTQYFLKDGDFDKFNKGKTWGWAGCNRLAPKQRICLSDGDPPLPATDGDALCGPTVVGTKKPAKGKKFADLNPCPLNACCNVWGQCGTTVDFCVDTTVNKTPGTAKNNTNGCVSNCGTDIVNNDKGPSSFSRVAYFEAWNKERDCLHMDVTEISEKTYTHIHFSFGTITDNFEINVKDVQKQFDMMVNWDTKLKKIISFGGWAFSTEPATISVFRRGVTKDYREKFASNVVAFVNKHQLDGVDFDWEYPGADDIPGTTPGGPDDGDNYVEFLKLVRSKLADSKSVSIAAPASYWYLQWFPMKDIGKVVDYIIYMTYDLHGQWDVNNEYAQPGCKSGTCLRSHVNKTETESALSMVTKAGVPSTKLFIGISSFGRSFKMAKKDCKGPMCKYLGAKNKSPAKKGECTGESGYLADAEIRQIMLIGDGYGGAPYESWYDKESDSDMLVYDNVEWVAYMGAKTKEKRVDWYKGLNFGGVSDWAVDLGLDRADTEREGDGDLDLGDFKECDWSATFSSLKNLADKSEGMDPVCAAVHALRVLTDMLHDAMDGYDDVADGYDGLFDTYANYIKKTLNSRLEEFMREGSKHFKCLGARGLNAKKDDASSLPCEDVRKKPGIYENWNFWYELDDKKGYEDGLWDFGIDPDWTHRGFPRGKDDVEIPDPKEVMDKARGNLKAVESEFFAMEIDMSLGQWEGSPEDVIQVLSAPVFMLMDALTSIKEVKEMGKEIEEAQEKDLILTILSGVLFLIPFVGAALGAAAGLSVYEIIDDPSSAPFAILGMLLGTGRVGGARAYRDLGKIRKDMKGNGAAEKMGDTWKKQDPHVQKIVSNSCRRK
ncbi:unnamed protein product [Parascedosporium putredinis]|uniref:chitinase n=1 Tax=Parascedosporium putredinis TaxID=1442378 RepID=A0A9P1GTL5_9PEZI|nr:unnamed protein product [Parascedosporium putredinis]CAI7987394.1 unnamed protein product [Parascedosporium putredinis]